MLRPIALFFCHFYIVSVYGKEVSMPEVDVLPEDMPVNMPSGNNASAEYSAPVKKEPLYPDSYGIIGVLKGRREILTATRYITPDNVADELRKARGVFEANRSEIRYLWNYYRGQQPILGRVKDVRPEICARIVENHADEVVSFKTGYNFGEPYVLSSRSEDDCSEAIQQLNAWNAENDHDALDMELGTWMFVCGLGYKIVLPTNESIDQDPDITSPYRIAVLSPMETFVVYYNGIQKIPVMGVKVIAVENEVGTTENLYCVYTKDRYYEIKLDTVTGNEILNSRVNPLGMIPIVEYPLNLSRRGALDPIIPLMDALNELASNRLDGVSQFIQSLMIFRNVDVSSEDVDKLSRMGAIKYKDTDPSSPGEVRYLTAELNQEGSQTLKDDLYESIVIISGLPNRNGGSSTSDNVGAVIYRDGWSAAETKARETDKFYERAEKNLLKVILKICRETKDFDVHLANIRVTPTRKNYENSQTKSQVLTTMLGNEKIAPRLAFTYSGMFPDPEAAWKESMEYYEKNATSQAKETQEEKEDGDAKKTSDSVS